VVAAVVAAMSWWRRLSLRARLVLIGTAGLAVALTAGVLVLVGVLEHTLVRTQDAGAQRTARDMAALVDTGQLPQVVPVGGTAIVQVVDAGGRVRAASAGGDRLVSALDQAQLAALRTGDKRYLPGDLFAVDGPVRVVGLAAGPPGDPQTVVVAVPAGELHGTVRLVRVVLAAGFGVLLLGLVMLAWRVVGWTLRPVEALRRGAEEITGAAAAGPLPVPESRDEIHRLAVTLNGMLDRLAAARRRQRAFVADAAHELRSPLANMRTELEVARATGSPPGLEPDLLADLLVDVDRLSRLVDDLLLLARADDAEGAALRRREPVDLAELVRETAERYARGPVPVTVSSNGRAVVDGDPDALRRVVANLLDNAVRHARSAAHVSVTSNGTEAVLRVADDGPGIPAADRQRAFERFTRLDEGRSRDGGGAGLGLAIVAELVRLHGGHVELNDARADGVHAPPEVSTADAPAAFPGLVAEVRLPVHHE
jgi:signal transduction histidine kinase